MLVHLSFPEFYGVVGINDARPARAPSTGNAPQLRRVRCKKSIVVLGDLYVLPRPPMRAFAGRKVHWTFR
jgi:hypothetical protein